MVQSRTDSAKDQNQKQIQDLLSRRKFTEAEGLIRERLLKSPGDPESHYLLGVFHYFQGEINQTVENLKKTLSLDPKHTDAAICLSVLYNDIGKYEDARKVFEQANQSVVHNRLGDHAEIDKKFSVKHLELADLYYRYRRYDEAIEEYTKAARLDPSAIEIRMRRAKAYAKKGFLTRSLQELQQLKSEYPQSVATRIQIGLLHYSQGNLLDAELEWEHVLALDSANKEALAYIEMARKNRIKL